MKKIIRWLADVSGVTLQIQVETMKDCGYRLYDAHYWWSGGLMHAKGKNDVLNAFYLWANDLKEAKFPDISRIREKVYEMDGHRYDEYEAIIKPLKDRRS